MWSAGRCLATFEDRLPAAVTVEVRFRRPLLLPGTVALRTVPLRTTDTGTTDTGTTDTGTTDTGGGGWRFDLREEHSGTPHVEGVIEPLPA